MGQLIIYSKTALILALGIYLANVFALHMMIAHTATLAPITRFASTFINAGIAITTTKSAYEAWRNLALPHAALLMEKGPIVNRLIFSLAALGLLLAPAAVQAQSQKTDIRPLANQVTGDDITTYFSGVTHDGAYNFTREGTARGFYTETHTPNGSTLYREGELLSKGIWFIKNDTLCYAYENQRMSGGCFRVYRIKNCFYFYSDRMPRRDDELDRDYWIARSTLKGETPQCEAGMI